MATSSEHVAHATAATLLAEGRALQALARSLVGKDAAEDVVQDAAVVSLRAPQSTSRRLGAWLAGAVRNLAQRRRRSDHRRRHHERAAAASAVDDSSDPAAIAAQSELAADVSAAVHALAEPFRTAVVMRFWRGMKPEAIAAELKVPRNTVRSRLQRGLEAVRVRLDKKYGTRERWSAPMLLLARVRDGSAVAGGGAALWLVGGLMQGKVLVGAAAIVIAATTVSLRNPNPANAPVIAAAAASSPVAADSGFAGPNVRSLVDSPAPADPTGQTSESPPTAAAAPPIPWLANLKVVNEDDEPVADAAISIWAGDNVAHGLLPWQWPTADLALRTDRFGSAAATLAFEPASAVARSDGKSSNAVLLTNRSTTTETKVVVAAPIAVRGRVVRADGCPGAEAIVETAIDGTSATIGGRPVTPAAVVADAQGCFSVALPRHAQYRLTAVLDGRRSLSASVSTSGAESREVMVVFPGTFTLSGNVVDPDGRPMSQADVLYWEDDPNPGMFDHWNRVVSDERGHFAIQLGHCARYQVFTAADDFAASDVSWVEVTEAVRHVETSLVLQRLASIRGVVVHADRTPFRGVHVSAHLDANGPQQSLLPFSASRFASGSPVATADDGSFTLMVHPGTTWTVCAQPLPHAPLIAVEHCGVRPGTSDLEIVVGPEQLAECVVHGALVGADGAPFERGQLSLFSGNATGRFVRCEMHDSTFVGGRFEVRGLPIGRTWLLRAQAETGLVADGMPVLADVPMACSAPFTSTAGGIEIQLRVPDWAEVPIRILDVDGQPARDAVLVMTFDMGSGVLGRRMDGTGTMVMKKQVPGVHHVLVSRTNGTPVLCFDVTVVPGLNPELTIRLPAKPPATGR
jgi:RNA polymerase sigma-70 factor (ECF subfamily)